MDSAIVEKKFRQIGARSSIRPLVAQRWNSLAQPVLIDIRRDRVGEYFDIQAVDEVEVEVVDLQPRDRHLLLMVRQPAESPTEPERKDKYLCGHDERHWFVAAVPGRRVSSVVTAKDALKPLDVRRRETGRAGKPSRRHRRRTEVFVRQGEWFFLPVPNLQVDQALVLRNEPIQRGGGKPHLCELLYRRGGQTVYVCRNRPRGLLVDEYRELLQRKPKAIHWNWQTMRRDPEVFVWGKVSHPDHATLRLDCWHRVVMNTEHESPAARNVVFLD